MCSALVIIGLALVLALQVAIHLRLVNIPARAAEHVRSEVLKRTRAEADAVKERAAKSVGDIVNSLNKHHERIQRYQDDLAETYCAEIATLQGRAREREARVMSFADLVSALREVTSELCALRDDLRKTSVPLRVPERRPPMLPRAAIPPLPPLADEELSAADPDARQTVESPPPPSCAPPPPVADDDEADEELTVMVERPAALCEEGSR
jgi:hypothetical protein